ncbi:hypothetical protein F2Q69_00037389 [Brassica cretica]|uniref:Uncharacterized protein n=1 Tax=Brassica cretica TaxID=69181 RepID=A0A8S9SSI7_BRACR|nr:hypothetical protein F2Q69_00037389 [Brassica cretica]
MVCFLGSRRQRVVGLFNVGVVNRWRKPGGGTRWSLISQHRRQLCGYAGGKVSRHLKLGDAIPFAFCCRHVRLSIRGLKDGSLRCGGDLFSSGRITTKYRFG